MHRCASCAAGPGVSEPAVGARRDGRDHDDGRGRIAPARRVRRRADRDVAQPGDRPLPGRGPRTGRRRAPRGRLTRDAGLAGGPVLHRCRHARTGRARAGPRPGGAHRCSRGDGAVRLRREPDDGLRAVCRCGGGPAHRDQPDQGERPRAAPGGRAAQPRWSGRRRARHAARDSRIRAGEALRRDRLRPPRGRPIQRAQVRTDPGHQTGHVPAGRCGLHRLRRVRPSPRSRLPAGGRRHPAVHQHGQHGAGHGRHPCRAGRIADQLPGVLLRHLPGRGVRQPVPPAAEPQCARLLGASLLALAGAGRTAVGGEPVQRRAVGDLGRPAGSHLPPRQVPGGSPATTEALAAQLATRSVPFTRGRPENWPGYWPHRATARSVPSPRRRNSSR